MPSQARNLCITVVTVTFNAAEHLEETILSILDQDYPYIQYIIIDGGSTDGTLDIINRYRKRISYTTSEPDRNLYDGMNKGSRAATGDLTIFMNAGDRFFSHDTVSRVVALADPTADLIYGHCVKIVSGFLHPLRPGKLPDLWKHMIFCHQSLFTRTGLIKEYPFDISRHISADFHFVFTMWQQGRTFQEVPVTVCLYLEGGVSTRNAIEAIRQNYAIVRAYRDGVFFRIYYQLTLRLVQLKLMVKSILPRALVVGYHRFRSSPVRRDAEST